MSLPEPDRSSARRILSALADGDCTDGESARAFQAWRDDDDTRVTWHAYHLIGDVLRSDDLATHPSGDQSFLLSLRARLTDEPVVLAPPSPAPVQADAVASPAVANARGGGWSRGRWQAPLAMAAGFLAVIGGYNVMRPGGHAADASLALAPATAASVAGSPNVVAASLQVPAPAPAQADSAQLAPYLAAHRQSTMNSAFQMPSGDIRNASLVQTAP